MNALITGAARGIGRGCALALARSGADVLVNDRPGSEDLPHIAGEIRALGRQCAMVEADVFSRRGCEQLVRDALDVFDRIDVLVSNPAWGVRCDFLDFDPSDFERVVAATLTSGFHLGQLVARHMVQRGGGGKIVFISSVQTDRPMARCAAYGAAKAGLNHLARTMAVELAKHRINVNAIEPGWIDTPGEREAFDGATIRREGAKLPLGRLGTADEIGESAAFLCSNRADYITGSILSVDGGFRFRDCRADEVIPAKEQKR